MLSALSLPRPPKLISMYVKYTNKIISLRACPFGKEQGQAKERPGEGVPGDIFSLLHEGKLDFLNIPFKKQQFGDMDVTKSPQ